MRFVTTTNSTSTNPWGGWYPDDPSREEYERDLRERQRRHLQSIENGGRPWQPCLHDGCSNCHGTGVGKHGPCIHALSCPCPKCSPQC